MYSRIVAGQGTVVCLIGQNKPFNRAWTILENPVPTDTVMVKLH